MFSRENPLSSSLIKEFQMVALSRHRQLPPPESGSAPGCGAQDFETDDEGSWGSDFEAEESFDDISANSNFDDISANSNFDDISAKSNFEESSGKMFESDELYEPIEGQVGSNL
jgi:hypothetical protein